MNLLDWGPPLDAWLRGTIASEEGAEKSGFSLMADAIYVLTPAQQEVVDRIGDVRIGQRAYGEEVYIFVERDGHTFRYLLSGNGEAVRKDDLGPSPQPPH